MAEAQVAAGGDCAAGKGKVRVVCVGNECVAGAGAGKAREAGKGMGTNDIAEASVRCVAGSWTGVGCATWTTCVVVVGASI